MRASFVFVKKPSSIKIEGISDPKRTCETVCLILRSTKSFFCVRALDKIFEWKTELRVLFEATSLYTYPDGVAYSAPANQYYTIGSVFVKPGCNLYVFDNYAGTGNR